MSWTDVLRPASITYCFGRILGAYDAFGNIIED